MTQIVSTSDLDQFKKFLPNRPFDATNHKRLVESITEKNNLHLWPIQVNEKLQVMDGQHRLAAAKTLGIDVWYQVVPNMTVEDIIRQNTAVKRWSVHDFINCHMEMGNENFKKLVAFAKKMSTDALEAATYLMGHRHTSDTGTNESLRDGSFEFPNDKRVKEVENTFEKTYLAMEILHAKMIGNKSFLKGRRFRSALFVFLNNELVNSTVFMNKLQQRIDTVRPCANSETYNEMWKSIYNFRNQDPLP